MDVFVEQIIKKRFSWKDYLIFFGVLILGLLLILASAILVPSFLLFVAAGACFGGYWLVSSRNLEFEYSCTNGDLTIDKIINRRKRKRVISLDLKNVEEIGKYDAAKHAQKNYAKRIFATITEDGREGWFLHLRHPQFGDTLLVFNPNERVIAAMKPFLPRLLVIHAFERN